MRFLTFLLLTLATSASAAENVLPLWPEGVPGKRVEPSKTTLDRIGPKGNRPGRGRLYNGCLLHDPASQGLRRECMRDFPVFTG